MPSLRGFGAALAAALVLAGCALVTPTDPRLCSAAQNLSQAMALVATAIEADGKGEPARAQGLATQSRTLGELGHATLQAAPDAQQAAPAFQALLEVYLHAGQAANALLPAYEGTHATAVSEYEAASAALGKARAELPAMCFALPADIETPGST